jgi:hypothetical protein
MATNQHATTEELLRTVFSVIHTMAIATQGCSKRLSMQQQLNYNNRRAVFSAWSVLRGYKQGEVQS